MINDKKLFEIMIKYHPIFVGWLIHNNTVIKEDDGLALSSDECNNNETDIFNLQTYQPIMVYENGVKRILYDSYDRSKTFISIKLTDSNGYKRITSSGINIYDINNRSERYCHISQFLELLNNFSNILFDAYIPANFPRFKGKTRENYISILERQIEFIKSNDYKFYGYYSFNYSILGSQSGIGENQPQKAANVKKHGFFSNSDIYKRIEWDFDLVEKYKDQIVWRELINESNLIWEEEMIIKYENYIPFCKTNADTYCDKFVHIDYSKFGLLSNAFLEKHKDVLDWTEVFKKCKFNWNGDELEHFCNYALSINMPYSEAFLETSAASQIKNSIYCLIDNLRFTWTQDNLIAYLNIDDYCWKKLVKKHRPDIFRVLLSIPNINGFASPHVNDIEHFWEIVNNPNAFPYDELTPEFTIENIQQHKNDWSKPIRKKLLTMRRTPDTNYYYYYIETQWDIYSNRKNIPLTYELAKYLSGIEIKIGGTYMESDGGTIEEDLRFPVFNGLQWFSHHHIASYKDIMMCLADDEVADIMLANHNSDMINAIIDLFFKDYSVKDYIEIINRQKEWDVIDEFYDN